MILVSTNHPYLMVRQHRCYQRYYGYNTSYMILFLKTAMRICLNAHIRTIVVLRGGKLTGIYLPHLLSVTMHREEGMKVSILSSGNVNPELIPSR
jgi:hypothetical protein